MKRQTWPTSISKLSDESAHLQLGKLCLRDLKVALFNQFFLS
ncbi:hypothetical protein Pla144_46750 [Bythopirellula polymerisocia]|uniref:Uncharacterized protein n=1 Tax=Bythopirellula polymerisocia TaxID=2528003 RepID=A0A5C6CD13_9BACT|nr:hypothetical protein Pla144_46750 [Bythopirellula polymerisocia]